MKKGTTVRLKKIAATANPECQPADMSEYKPGRIDLVVAGNGIVAVENIPNEGKSLPIQYTLQGVLLDDIEVGKPLRLHRTHRNGEEVMGFTETSPIENFGPNVEGFVLFTRNSVYWLDVVTKES